MTSQTSQTRKLQDTLTTALQTAASLDDDELAAMQAALAVEAERRAAPPSGVTRKASGTFLAAPRDTLGGRMAEIAAKEGFRIEVPGVAVDERGFAPYAFERRMRSDSTVQQWKALRFARFYPGHEVRVLMGDGSEARAAAHLETVLASYVK